MGNSDEEKKRERKNNIKAGSRSSFFKGLLKKKPNN